MDALGKSIDIGAKEGIHTVIHLSVTVALTHSIARIITLISCIRRIILTPSILLQKVAILGLLDKFFDFSRVFRHAIHLRQIVQVIIAMLNLLGDKGDPLRILVVLVIYHIVIVIQGVRVIFEEVYIIFETTICHHISIEVVEIVLIVFGRAIYCCLLCIELGKLEQFRELGADVGPLLLACF